MTNSGSSDSGMRDPGDEYRKFKFMVDGAGQEVYLVRPDGRLAYLNRAAVESLGYREEEILQMGVPGFDPIFGDVFLQHFREVKERGMPPFETIHIAKDGTRIPKEVKSVYLKIGSEEYLCAFVSDITERKEASEELRKFKTISDRANYGTAITDLEGKILYANEAFAVMHDLRVEELLGENLAVFHTEDQMPRVIDLLTRLRQSGNFSAEEVWHRRKDGTLFPTLMNATLIRDEQDRPLFLSATAVEISDLKSAERAVQESEEKYRKLIETANVAIIVADTETSLILEVNRRAEELLGYSSPELIGMHQADLHPPEKREEYMKMFQHDIRAVRTRAFEQEVHVRHKEGRLIPVEIRSSVVEVSGKKIIQGIFTDVSERRKGEERERRYREELEKQLQTRIKRIQELERQRMAVEKLAAAGRMAARIAHEINNPLAGILNVFNLIKDAVPKDHEYYECVSLVEDEISRIARIVHQMFDLYQPEQETPKNFRVSDIILEVVALLEPSCRKQDVTIEVETEDPPPVVHIPEGQLRQVLFNVLQNAIEASPAGGMVSCNANHEKNRLCIAVEDGGPGIEEEHRSKVFEPFFTTKERMTRRGLGLGLSTSKSLVEGMGGTLDFTTEPGKGTIFRIHLPRYMPKGGDG